MTGGLRELKKRRTKAAIQQEAVRLITDQGFDATTVEQIAAAAEISPATFFRYFRTKEDVVLQDDYDPMLLAAFEHAPPELGPIAAMRHALADSLGQLGAEEIQAVFARAKLIMTVPALRARSLDNLLSTIDLLVRALIGAIVGAWMAVLMEWIDQGGTRSLAELMDEALVALQQGLD
jgi:AcrR family transcriptional regulator